MADISKYLELLESPNKNKRYEACEELRVAENLPPHAISALQRATYDSDPLVADAARRALQVHTEPAPSYPQPIITQQPALSDAHGSEHGTSESIVYPPGPNPAHTQSRLWIFASMIFIFIGFACMLFGAWTASISGNLKDTLTFVIPGGIIILVSIIVLLWARYWRNSSVRLTRDAPATAESEIFARMQKEIRNWGLWLLAIGVIYFLLSLSNSLTAAWGILLILVGIASFYFKEPAMFVIYAVTIAWAGISNLTTGQLTWVVAAVGQWILAIYVFQKFLHYRKAQINFEQDNSSDIASVSLPTKRAPEVFPWAGCLFGSLSFLGVAGIFFGAIGFVLASGNQETPTFMVFLESLFVVCGVLGASLSLASLLSGYGRKILTIGGIVTSALVLIFELVMVFLY